MVEFFSGLVEFASFFLFFFNIKFLYISYIFCSHFSCFILFRVVWAFLKGLKGLTMFYDGF